MSESRTKEIQDGKANAKERASDCALDYGPRTVSVGALHDTAPAVPSALYDRTPTTCSTQWYGSAG